MYNFIDNKQWNFEKASSTYSTFLQRDGSRNFIVRNANNLKSNKCFNSTLTLEYYETSSLEQYIDLATYTTIVPQISKYTNLLYK